MLMQLGAAAGFIDYANSTLGPDGNTIDHLELSTPLSTRNFVAHPHGEIYGLAHTPARFAMRDLRPKTRLSGLYLTGADVCTAGIGSALLSGVLTASVMTGRNLLKAILKAPDRQPRYRRTTNLLENSAVARSKQKEDGESQA